MSDCIVTQKSVTVMTKCDNPPVEKPERGRAAAAACDVTGAMRSPPCSDFVMVIVVFVMLGNDLKIT